MIWIHELDELMDYTHQDLLRLSCIKGLSCEEAQIETKGVLHVVTNTRDKVVGYKLVIQSNLSLEEKEVTLVHELFHLAVGMRHPAEHRVSTTNLSSEEVSLVETKIEKAAYRFCDEHPEFISDLYHLLFPWKRP